jgi:hypothetical protein
VIVVDAADYERTLNHQATPWTSWRRLQAKDVPSIHTSLTKADRLSSLPDEEELARWTDGSQ